MEPPSKRPRADGDGDDAPKKYTTITLRQCHKLLQAMKAVPESFYFTQKVDHVALNIPDYPLIVKKPMDLGTIETRLQKGEYLEVDDFVADVRLVFYNCRIYNQPNNPVGLAGAKVGQTFEEALEKSGFAAKEEGAEEGQRMPMYSKEKGPSLTANEVQLDFCGMAAGQLCRGFALLCHGWDDLLSLARATRASLQRCYQGLFVAQ